MEKHAITSRAPNYRSHHEKNSRKLMAFLIGLEIIDDDYYEKLDAFGWIIKYNLFFKDQSTMLLSQKVVLLSHSMPLVEFLSTFTSSILIIWLNLDV